MTYYKAVRPDGTDFATGSTRPVVGAWMPEIEGDLVMCERGYHVSQHAAETLVGGRWPCRLFEVEISAEHLADEKHPHKLVCRTYRPVRELPAWQALGPNGEAVAALIARSDAMTHAQAVALAAARNAAWDAVWRRVRW